MADEVETQNAAAAASTDPTTTASEAEEQQQGIADAPSEFDELEAEFKRLLARVGLGVDQIESFLKYLEAKSVAHVEAYFQKKN